MKKYILFSICSSVIIYTLISFIFWDIAIIKQIPSLHAPERFILVLAYLVKEGLLYLYFDEKKFFKSSEDKKKDRLLKGTWDI